MNALAMFTVTGALLVAGAPAFAQTTPPAPSRAPAISDVQKPGEVRADKLIGRNIQNPANETVGEIKSVMLSQSGQVDSVIVGVGGFLGMGEREVALGWKDLNVSADGEKVTTAMTKEQIKALPEYKYADTSQRGTVFGTRGDTTATRTAAPAGTAMPAMAAAGAVGASKLVGLTVRNEQNETVGEIKEVLVSNSGAVQSAIVGVGGFLGVGERNVALDWNQLKLARDNDQLRALVNMSKDQLKTLPEYQEQRGVWAPK